MSSPTSGRRTRVAMLAAALLVTACDDSDDAAPAPPALVVTSIQPIPYLAYRATTFSVTGSGFLRGTTSGAGSNSIGGGVAGETLNEVTVTFRTDDGTPFANGTSATAQVPATVISDTEIQGVSPPTDAAGIWPCTIEVADSLGTAATTAPVSAFVGLTVFDCDPPLIRSDQATPFQVIGLGFPTGGACRVRFSATVAGAFGSGASELVVPATIDNTFLVTGATPAFTLAAPVRAFVTVILDGEPGAPQVTSSNALVEFLPPPPVPVVVNTITSPLPLAAPTSFTISGSGFLGATDPDVEVTFRASAGTPFAGGTAVAATVLGTAIDDNTVTGTSPTGTSPVDVNAFVTVTRADAVAGTSATAIALLTAPLPVVTTFSPVLLRTDVATPFTILGTNLPAPQAATVRFRALLGTPFTGGTTDTVNVPANVTTASQIDGTSPLAVSSVPFLGTVTVLLQGGVELPMGAVCLFSPTPVVTCPVTNLNDSGPGSLRQVILDAVPGCVITFDESLSGVLDVDSTLLVPQSVHVLGPGVGQVRISAKNNDYPVFTIAPAATNTILELLTIRASRHDADGGGCVVRGGLTLVGCELTEHDVRGKGGCVYVEPGATLVMRDCTLRNSSSDDSGGAVHAEQGATVQIAGCTFDNNRCDENGGAISMASGAAVEVENCTFHKNTARGYRGGGAIFIPDNATVTLLHCTIAENTAYDEGGAVFNDGTLNARNCIFARNSGGEGAPEIFAATGVMNVASSLVRVGSGSGLVNGLNGNLVGTPVDPVEARLGALLENGGATRTMALRTDSPALDAATASGATKDQRGVARPQGPGPDMGAYESTVTL